MPYCGHNNQSLSVRHEECFLSTNTLVTHYYKTFKHTITVLFDVMYSKSKMKSDFLCIYHTIIKYHVGHPQSSNMHSEKWYSTTINSCLLFTSEWITPKLLTILTNWDLSLISSAAQITRHLLFIILTSQILVQLAQEPHTAHRNQYLGTSSIPPQLPRVRDLYSVKYIYTHRRKCV